MKNNTAIVLLLLSIGLFYTFTNSQYKEVKALNIQKNEYKDVLKNVSKIIELRDALLVTYAAIPKAEIERMDKVLPDNVDIVRLALDLDGMASRYGISIKDIKTTLGSSGGGNAIVLPENETVYNSATVSLSFVSNYENFKRLLIDIEKDLRIMDISSISFQAGESGLNQYQVSAETYWLK